MKSIYKVFRFFQIYGLERTIVKVAGRTRSSSLNFFFPKLLRKKLSFTSLIGCGQFGFSTISYFLLKEQGRIFLECFDVNKENQNSTAKFWKYQAQDQIDKLISNPACKIIYIASNHHSHTAYAIEALKKNKIVYIEKPISVNYDQLKDLLITRKEYKGELYVGYNRPFSAAISQLKENLPNRLPVTLNCFVIGHKLEKGHWYKNPEEGTRVCGNMGHWIDLAVHLLAAKDHIPKSFNISASYSNDHERDDNVAVTITTDFEDLITIVLSAREEPFEGINESINFQSGHTIAKIDDFRKMQLWTDKKYLQFSYKPKDVGHLKAINQPFSNQKRNFNEIIVSTILMLEITNMVKNSELNRTVIPQEIQEKLLQKI